MTHYVEEALYLGQQIALMAAHPGTVQEVRQNELADSRKKRQTAEFFAAGQQLRDKIKAMEVRR